MITGAIPRAPPLARVLFGCQFPSWLTSLNRDLSLGSVLSLALSQSVGWHGNASKQNQRLDPTSSSFTLGIQRACERRERHLFVVARPWTGYLEWKNVPIPPTHGLGARQ